MVEEAMSRQEELYIEELRRKSIVVKRL
jgi:hypothetical protein